MKLKRKSSWTGLAGSNRSKHRVQPRLPRFPRCAQPSKPPGAKEFFPMSSHLVISDGSDAISPQVGETLTQVGAPMVLKTWVLIFCSQRTPRIPRPRNSATDHKFIARCILLHICHGYGLIRQVRRGLVSVVYGNSPPALRAICSEFPHCVSGHHKPVWEGESRRRNEIGLHGF